MDSMGRELLFAGAGRRGVIPASRKSPVEESLTRPTLSCGCIRAQLCCAAAKRFVAASEKGFEMGMRTGDWRLFEAARKALEIHLQTE